MKFSLYICPSRWRVRMRRGLFPRPQRVQRRVLKNLAVRGVRPVLVYLFESRNRRISNSDSDDVADAKNNNKSSETVHEKSLITIIERAHVAYDGLRKLFTAATHSQWRTLAAELARKHRAIEYPRAESVSPISMLPQVGNAFHRVFTVPALLPCGITDTLRIDRKYEAQTSTRRLAAFSSAAATATVSSPKQSFSSHFVIHRIAKLRSAVRSRCQFCCDRSSKRFLIQDDSSSDSLTFSRERNVKVRRFWFFSFRDALVDAQHRYLTERKYRENSIRGVSPAADSPLHHRSTILVANDEEIEDQMCAALLHSSLIPRWCEPVEMSVLPKDGALVSGNGFSSSSTSFATASKRNALESLPALILAPLWISPLHEHRYMNSRFNCSLNTESLSTRRLDDDFDPVKKDSTLQRVKTEVSSMVLVPESHALADYCIPTYPPDFAFSGNSESTSWLNITTACENYGELEKRVGYPFFDFDRILTPLPLWSNALSSPLHLPQRQRQEHPTRSQADSLQLIARRRGDSISRVPTTTRSFRTSVVCSSDFRVFNVSAEVIRVAADSLPAQRNPWLPSRPLQPDSLSQTFLLPRPQPLEARIPNMPTARLVREQLLVPTTTLKRPTALLNVAAKCIESRFWSNQFPPTGAEKKKTMKIAESTCESNVRADPPPSSMIIMMSEPCVSVNEWMHDVVPPPPCLSALASQHSQCRFQRKQFKQKQRQHGLAIKRAHKECSRYDSNVHRNGLLRFVPVKSSYFSRWKKRTSSTSNASEVSIAISRIFSSGSALNTIETHHTLNRVFVASRAALEMSLHNATENKNTNREEIYYSYPARLCGGGAAAFSSNSVSSEPMQMSRCHSTHLFSREEIEDSFANSRADVSFALRSGSVAGDGCSNVMASNALRWWMNEGIIQSAAQDALETVPFESVSNVADDVYIHAHRFHIYSCLRYSQQQQHEDTMLVAGPALSAAVLWDVFTAELEQVEQR